MPLENFDTSCGGSISSLSSSKLIDSLKSDMQAIALLHSQLQQTTARVEENRRLVQAQEDRNEELRRELNDELEIANMAKADINKFSEDLSHGRDEVEDVYRRNQLKEVEENFLLIEVQSHLTSSLSIVAETNNRAVQLSEDFHHQHQHLVSIQTRNSLDMLRSRIETKRSVWKKQQDHESVHADEFKLEDQELSLESDIQSLESTIKALKERYHRLHSSQPTARTSTNFFQDHRTVNQRPGSSNYPSQRPFTLSNPYQSEGDASPSQAIITTSNANYEVSNYSCSTGQMVTNDVYM
jgi:chromosome segregation ATPase